MPTLDQVRAARQAGLPYGVANNLTAVSAPSTVTSSQEATTNAATQTGAYVQADVQTIATLANSLKIKYNAAQTDISNLRGTVNNIVTALKNIGIVL